MLGCVVLLIALLAFGFFLHIQQLIVNSPKPEPQTVTTAVISTQEWQAQFLSVGTLTAVLNCDEPNGHTTRRRGAGLRVRQ
jgi:membrane fusion protein (multidrug efflux system)